jgi:hypothetical protein
VATRDSADALPSARFQEALFVASQFHPVDKGWGKQPHDWPAELVQIPYVDGFQKMFGCLRHEFFFLSQSLLHHRLRSYVWSLR